MFRYNEIFGNVGAGVRLGGATHRDGINNAVYGNHIHDNEAGGIKVQRAPQAQICANALYANAKGNIRGAADIPMTSPAQCPTATNNKRSTFLS